MRDDDIDGSLPPQDADVPPVPALLQLPELTRVTLDRAVESDEGRVPEGSTGTIVAVFGRGAGYAVEFTRPFHSVAMVPANAIRR